MNKFIWLFIVSILSLFISLLICIGFAKAGKTDILLNFVFIIAFAASASGVGFWITKFRERFESFLIFMVLFFLNLLFLYIGPLTVDRSLSTFMYFYAAEKGSVNQNIYNENYFKNFTQRRFEDGVKFGFLKCSDDICKPTSKGYLFYNILYPIGKITKTDLHYRDFKQIFP